MKVFISSVIRGLESEREATAEAIRSLGHKPIRAEDFSASPESAQVVCLAGVRQSDATVLILGERYGEPQASGESATHEEYREARQCHQPVLAFAKADMSPEPAQSAFLEEVRSWAGGEFNGRFKSSSELRAVVVRALHEFTLSRAVGPIDASEMRSRAEAAIPERTSSMAGEPQLIISVAGGPRQQVIRPQELEDHQLAQWLQQEAMFGNPAILDAASATETTRRGGRLHLEQSRRSVSVAEDGTIVIVQPAYEDSDRPGLRAVIHEDVVGRLSAALGYAGTALEQIDPVHRVSELVCLAAMLGASHGAWRSRSEQQASPNTMTMNISGAGLAIVGTSPPRIHRPALVPQAAQLAEDLAVLLRRAVIEDSPRF